MLKSYTINIKEIDDIEFALEELDEQMKDITLLKNTVGIVSTHIDYVHSGVYAAVCDVLPFTPLGGTTIFTATNDEMSTFVLSIMVLTSDDCEFSFAVSDAIPKKDGIAKVVGDCYKKVLAGLTSEPKLAFAFSLFDTTHFTDEYVAGMNAVNSTVPIFGTLTISEENNQFKPGRLLIGKDAYENHMAIVAVSGDISPKFYMASVSTDGIISPDVGIVTKSDHNRVYEVNNMSSLEFFTKIGYYVSNLDKGSQSTNILMRLKNEAGDVVSTWAGDVYAHIDGVGMFSTIVPVGTVLSVFSVTGEEIMKTAKDVVSRIQANHTDGTILMYTCASRQFTLVTEDPAKEYNYLRDELGINHTLLIAASGGEMCPSSLTDNALYNKGHSFTLVACAL